MAYYKRGYSRWSKGIRNGFDSNGGVVCRGCFQKDLETKELKAEILRLKAQIQRINKKVTKKDIDNTHMPSSKDSFKANTPEEERSKPGGAKCGHKGSGRKSFNKSEAERVIEIPKPAICPECEVGLNNRDIRERQIIECVPVKLEKVIYRCRRGICPKCFKVYASKPPALPKALYGNSLLSQAVIMHYVHGMTMGKVLSILGDKVSLGGLIDAFHRVGKICEQAKENLISDYRRAECKHADETGWRTDGRSGYAWLFCNATTSIFEFKNTRSSRVALEILGSQKLPGVLVVDRYGGYNQMPVDLQYCYAHLLREVEKLEDEFYGKEEVMQFVAELAPALALAMKLRGQNIADAEYYERAETLKEEIEKIIAKSWRHLGIKRIQQIFEEKRHRLYHWVKYRSVPPDNNRAERELRPTVIARKVSFGSQSDAGAKTRGHIMSVLFTAKKRLGDTSLEHWLQTALNKIAYNPTQNIYDLIKSDQNAIPTH